MKLNEVKGFENWDFMLVKFTKNQHAQDFLDGKLYMNNFNHFIKQEKESKHKGQGDSYEAAHVMKVEKVKIIEEGTGLLLGEAESGHLIERYDYFKKTPLFCLTLIKSKDLEVVEKTDSELTVKIGLSEEDKKKFKEDFQSDTAIFTLNHSEFTKRLRESAEKLETSIRFNNVEYVDYSVLDRTRKEKFDKGSLDFLFNKHHELEYQREFRIVLPEIRAEKNYSFNIGNVEDIFYVMDIDKFFEDIQIQISYSSDNDEERS